METPIPVASARITTWHDDARAAYSIIHDDLCGGAEGILTHVVPELRARGLRAGLATIAGSCESAGLTAPLRELAGDGFEIVNHSYSHAHLTPELVQQEVVEAKRLLESATLGPVTFFAFPYDEFNAEMIGLVKAAGHLGARAGEKGVNAWDFPDPMQIAFDAFGPYSSYGTGLASLDGLVDAAMEIGGFALRECHGVEDESWEPVSLSDYRAHLDRVAALVQSHDLWMAPPSTVVRYRLARDRCDAPIIKENRILIEAVADGAAPDTTLTVAITLAASHPDIIVTAAGEALPTRQNSAGEWIVSLTPGTPAEITVPIR